jgi:hypothetical protein
MDASEDLLATGAFVECVFSCPSCGLAGTSLVRPKHLIGKTCYGCGEPVVLTVFERFRRSGSRTSDSEA